MLHKDVFRPYQRARAGYALSLLLFLVHPQSDSIVGSLRASDGIRALEEWKSHNSHFVDSLVLWVGKLAGQPL